LDDVRRKTPTKSAKYFACGTGIVVLAAVVYAFFIVGSPATARLIQFDQQKVSNLADIQSQIVNYWQSKEKLPESFSDLTDPISGYKAPTDPQSGASYEYFINDATTLSFALCATFNKPSQKIASEVMYPVNENWDHASGRVCFERTIDRQLYPPFSKIK